MWVAMSLFACCYSRLFAMVQCALNSTHASVIFECNQFRKEENRGMFAGFLFDRVCIHVG